MTARDWKPGDVAMVTDRTGYEEIGFCIKAGPVGVGSYEEMAHWRVVSGEVWSSVTDVRPLVVLDPDDAEQAERLAGLLVEHRAADAVAHSGVRDALRDIARPPKPPEPTGLGAVVEDADGVRWVRLDRDATPWVDGKSFPQRWRDIDAVHVLSLGVQP